MLAVLTGMGSHSGFAAVQAQYHACLAQAAPFCEDPQSSHSKHFQAVMGEAMALLAVFAECLPEQFLASQSINMLDGISKMPPPAFEALKVCAGLLLLQPFSRVGIGQKQSSTAEGEQQRLLSACEVYELAACKIPLHFSWLPQNRMIVVGTQKAIANFGTCIGSWQPPSWSRHISCRRPHRPCNICVCSMCRDWTVKLAGLIYTAQTPKCGAPGYIMVLVCSVVGLPVTP